MECWFSFRWVYLWHYIAFTAKHLMFIRRKLIVLQSVFNDETVDRNIEY